MIVYRITLSKFKDDISGQGSALFGGRWNSKGVYVLYCAEHVSLAVLEMVVNYDQSSSPILPSYHLLDIELPETANHLVTLPPLKKNWERDLPYTQFIGDHFISEGKFLAMKIPSAVIQEESNWMINPHHPDFKKIKIKKSKLYQPDSRLFKV